MCIRRTVDCMTCVLAALCEICADLLCSVFFFFKQKTAYEIGTGDWSSDVCSSDLTKAYNTIMAGTHCAHNLRLKITNYRMKVAVGDNQWINHNNVYDTLTLIVTSSWLRSWVSLIVIVTELLENSGLYLFLCINILTVIGTKHGLVVAPSRIIICILYTDTPLDL